MAKNDIMINKCRVDETSENKIIGRMFLLRSVFIVGLFFYLYGNNCYFNR